MVLQAPPCFESMTCRIVLFLLFIDTGQGGPATLDQRYVLTVTQNLQTQPTQARLTFIQWLVLNI